jgi:hypothetical protein
MYCYIAVSVCMCIYVYAYIDTCLHTCYMRKSQVPCVQAKHLTRFRLGELFNHILFPVYTDLPSRGKQCIQVFSKQHVMLVKFSAGLEVVRLIDIISQTGTCMVFPVRLRMS